MEKQKKIPALRFPEFTGEWEIRLSRNISDIYDGTHQTPDYVESGVKFVSVENIGDIQNTDKFITEAAFEKNFKNKPQKDDILMTRITAGIIGATSIVKNNDPLAYYVSLALFRAKECINVNFLNQAINSTNFKHELHKRIIHVAFPKKINLGDIGECKVSFPKLPEQTKIATFLTAIDDRLNQLKQKKTLLEHYKKGVMQNIFNQQIRFKDDNGNEFPDWDVRKLAEVATKKSSNISANKIEDNFGTYIIYGASGILKKVDFYKEENDYISIIKDGAGVGRIFYCEGKTSVLGTMDIIKPKININTYFLYCLLNNIDFVKYITGSTIPHIYFKDYSHEICGIPCQIEQTKIANFLSAIDEKINCCTNQISKTEQYKKGLLQQMFI